MSNSVKFAPFKSYVDTSFFKELSSRKLNDMKLEQPLVPLVGSYTVPVGATPGTQPAITLKQESFDVSRADDLWSPQPNVFVSPGLLYNANTVEEFKNCDRNALAGQTLRQIFTDALENNVDALLDDPARLNPFFLLTFCDLKKFKFYYWFAFPSLSTPWTLQVLPATHYNLHEPGNSLAENVRAWLRFDAAKGVSEAERREKGFFLLRESAPDVWDVAPLRSFSPNYWESAKPLVGFVDASAIPGTPAWGLRNFLALLARLGVLSAEVVCFRDVSSSAHAGAPQSFVLEASCADPRSPAAGYKPIFGWERTSEDRLGPKGADLGALIDPVQLAEQAADLNLKLMKWRLAPELNLDVIAQSKCLLLGAGTLGTYVARGLLAWGVRHITFVDSGKVSFSNPVRQSLYSFADCLDGGKWKAAAAAEALRQIFPNVKAEGYRLEVPMAGHPVVREAAQRADFELLAKLVDEHDTIFLLVDSRETRWLPTVMGNARGKLVINAALGFDSYVVMRHGCVERKEEGIVEEATEREEAAETVETEAPAVGLEETGIETTETDQPGTISASGEPQKVAEAPSNQRLGCYFCTDIVAPIDSLRDRTLDQMCTVTRPGVAMYASAAAVELFAATLQHPRRQYAPAAASRSFGSSNKSGMVLGEPAHQIRGFISSNSMISASTEAYPYCSACSLPVLEAYEQGGWDFVKAALADMKYVEDLCGLTEVQRVAEAFDDEEIDWE